MTRYEQKQEQIRSMGVGGINHKVCIECISIKTIAKFHFTLPRIGNFQMKTPVSKNYCITCLTCYDKSKVPCRKKFQMLLEKTMEKEKALTKYFLIDQSNKGCPTSTCGFDMKAIFEIIKSEVTLEIAEYKLECYDGCDATIDDIRFICCYIWFEWDHIDRTTKWREVASIYNTIKRNNEIKKCILRCIICHRIKSFINREHLKITMVLRSVSNKLKEKWNRYQIECNEAIKKGETKPCCGLSFDRCVLGTNFLNNNVCQSINIIDQSIDNFNEQYASIDTLSMMTFDFAHDDRTKKDRNKKSINDEGTTMTCAIDHKITTYLYGETNNYLTSKEIDKLMFDDDLPDRLFNTDDSTNAVDQLNELFGQ